MNILQGIKLITVFITCFIITTIVIFMQFKMIPNITQITISGLILFFSILLIAIEDRV